MKKFISAGFILATVPFISSAAAGDPQAANAFSIFGTIGSILSFVIPILITLAVVYFVWGVIQYTVSTDEEAKKKAKSGIIQGLIGLFVILSFWGIVRVIQNTFGVSGVQLNSGDVPSILPTTPQP
jgi:hypothetical protein